MRGRVSAGPCGDPGVGGDRRPADERDAVTADRPPARWTGREDGAGAEHARWHSVIEPWAGEDAAGCAVLVGFVSDEGIWRNQGRVGAGEGPAALRAALASLSDPGLPLRDAGDVVVDRDRLESAQARLGAVVGAILDAGGLPVVLGGGHEVAYGSYLGWAGRFGWGILNVDAHFDLRDAPRATSGTPFRQIADAEGAAGRPFRYGVVGISPAGNTRALFDAAGALGVPHLTDEACTRRSVRRFARSFLDAVDRVHLTLDLDALPAAVAPGVSAPAGFGIEVDAVRAAVAAVVGSGKLGLLEVAELNPRFDVDGRTARTASRLVDEALRLVAAGRTARPKADPGPSPSGAGR